MLRLRSRKGDPWLWDEIAVGRSSVCLLIVWHTECDIEGSRLGTPLESDTPTPLSRDMQGIWVTQLFPFTTDAGLGVHDLCIAGLVDWIVCELGWLLAFESAMMVLRHLWL